MGVLVDGSDSNEDERKTKSPLSPKPVTLSSKPSKSDPFSYNLSHNQLSDGHTTSSVTTNPTNISSNRHLLSPSSQQTDGNAQPSIILAVIPTQPSISSSTSPPTALLRKILMIQDRLQQSSVPAQPSASYSSSSPTTSSQVTYDSAEPFINSSDSSNTTDDYTSSFDLTNLTNCYNDLNHDHHISCPFDPSLLPANFQTSSQFEQTNIATDTPTKWFNPDLSTRTRRPVNTFPSTFNPDLNTRTTFPSTFIVTLLSSHQTRSFPEGCEQYRANYEPFNSLSHPYHDIHVLEAIDRSQMTRFYFSTTN